MKYLHSLQSVAGNSGSAAIFKSILTFLAARVHRFYTSPIWNTSRVVFTNEHRVYTHSIDAKTRAIKFVVEFGAKCFATQSHGLNIDSRTHLMQFVCVGTTTLLVLLPWCSFTLRCSGSKGSVNRCDYYFVSGWCLMLQSKVP